MASEAPKLKLSKPPFKKDKAWFLTFENGQEDWFPFTTINEYNPATLTVRVDTWILIQKQIKFKF